MIAIDDRERDLIAEYRRQGLPHLVRHLSVGDLAKGNCVIERKEAHDFLSSIADKRIISQCDNMIRYFSKAVIIVEGDIYSAIAGTQFNRHAVLGMLASIIGRTNINIVHAFSIEDLAYLSFKILGKAADGKPFSTEVVRKTNAQDKRIAILTQIEGVSAEKARAIIKKYPTFGGLVEADTPELTRISGIGLRLAANIRAFFSVFRC